MRAMDEVLSSVFGLSGLRGVQGKAIAPILEGRDTLVVAPTGEGKSLIFQLPGVMAGRGISIVISPLIALMDDQVGSLVARGVNAAALHSAMSEADQERVLQRMIAGELSFLYLAPERLVQRDSKLHSAIRNADRINMLVLDEAHCIATWGHDFRPAYQKVADVMAELLAGRTVQPVKVALTASATSAVAKEIVQLFQMDDPAIVNGGVVRSNIDIRVNYVQGDKKFGLMAAIGTETDQPTIIYCSTVVAVESLYGRLKDRMPVAAYHGRMTSEQRVAAQSAFMRDATPILITTKAFGMGVNKPNIRKIIHYGIPGSIEDYVQEIGRAGRDGLPAKAILLYGAEDMETQRFFIEGSNPSVRSMMSTYAFISAMNDQGVMDFDAQLIALNVPEISNQKSAESVLRALYKEGAIEMHQQGSAMLIEAKKGFVADEKALTLKKQIAYRRLDKLVGLVRSRSCILGGISEYFSTTKLSDCGRCSACLPDTGVESERSVVPSDLVLKLMKWAGSRIKPGSLNSLSAYVLVDALNGVDSLSGKTLGTSLAPFYGALKSYPSRGAWQLLEELETRGYISLTKCRRKLVTLCRLGREAVSSGIVEPLSIEALPCESSGVISKEDETPESDHFEKLRKLRKVLAMKECQAPFQIFNEMALRQLVKKKPTTIAELAAISDLPESTRVKYGAKLVSVFAPLTRFAPE